MKIMVLTGNLGLVGQQKNENGLTWIGQIDPCLQSDMWAVLLL